jgi:acyl carrier protein
MKRNTKSTKASTASSADNITLDVPTPVIAGKANGSRNKNHKNASNGSIDEIDSYELLRLLLEVKEGNFSVRMPGDKLGISGKICDTLNGIIQLNEAS